MRTVIQREEIDQALRYKLWDVVHSCLDQDDVFMEYSTNRVLYLRFWSDYLERALDSVPATTAKCNAKIREIIYLGEWYEAYDVVEFILQNSELDSPDAKKHLNSILQRYLSAYRYVGGQIVEITDETSIAAVESSAQNPLQGVRSHISNSLALLKDRKSPDPANSIKESISAVESLCSSIVGKKTTLGAAIKQLESVGVVIHPALQKAWLALHGWTGDADGVRHAMQDDPNLSIDDALYVLVSASAFVSLLTEKANSAGVALKPVS